MAMEPGENLTKFVLGVDTNVSQWADLRVQITKDILISTTINCFSDEYDTKRPLFGTEEVRGCLG